jgi:hypothetical protein
MGRILEPCSAAGDLAPTEAQPTRLETRTRSCLRWQLLVCFSVARSLRSFLVDLRLPHESAARSAPRMRLLNTSMSISRRSHLQRFRNFLLESQDEASLVTFAFTFAEPPLPTIEADLVALEVAAWLQSALGLEDGTIIMSAVEDGVGVYGWNVGVLARDAKQAALLTAYLDSGTIGPLSESSSPAMAVRLGSRQRCLIR